MTGPRPSWEPVDVLNVSCEMCCCVEWTPKVRHRNDNDFGGDRGS